MSLFQSPTSLFSTFFLTLLPLATNPPYNYHSMDTPFSLDTTIFAWATGPAPAARAILRAGGPETFTALEKIFTPDSPLRDLRQAPHQTLAGTLCFDDQLKLRAWLWIFPGPDSYTGQDMAELHIPGCPPLRKLIDQELLRLGLLPAKPGEFSARAFLLGKMDLTQAQAVQQLVAAENDAQVQAAMNLLTGSLHRQLEKIYRDLSALGVSLEANIDFSEEQIETITLDQAIQSIEVLRENVADILHRAIDTRSISSLPRVFLAGMANAGKSTLLNRLTGLDRAICSALPGTTRDILTAVWPYRQKEILLCDTPGLILNPPDDVTRSAVNRTDHFLRTADLVIQVFDAAQDFQTQLQLFNQRALKSFNTMIAINKTDIAGRHHAEKQIRELEFFELETGDDRSNIFFISGLTGEGLADLTDAVFGRLSGISLTTAVRAVALDLQGREILENTLACLTQARTDAHALKNNESFLGLETIAADIQQTLRTLGSLLGKDITEDVLENIFSTFCIGK